MSIFASKSLNLKEISIKGRKQTDILRELHKEKNNKY